MAPPPLPRLRSRARRPCRHGREDLRPPLDRPVCARYCRADTPAAVLPLPARSNVTLRGRRGRNRHLRKPRLRQFQRDKREAVRSPHRRARVNLASGHHSTRNRELVPPADANDLPMRLASPLALKYAPFSAPGNLPMRKAPFSEDRLNRVHKRARCSPFPALSIANPRKAGQSASNTHAIRWHRADT